MRRFDFHFVYQTIRIIGREDRAMLGSNPSARNDGGNITKEHSFYGCSWPPQDDDVLAYKAINP
jgi:hypothetical protein